MLESRNFLITLTLAALLLAGDAHAQAEQTPENLLDEPLPEQSAEAEPENGQAAGEAKDEAASRETDFNEENFRRSMELRDATLQRSPDLTTGTYSRQTGVQALDALPEASQKHLREQLRKVIVENGPWTPADAGEVYPYEPSTGAKENGTLAKREQAAWTELVAKYHEREAAIHANAGRGQASMSTSGTDGAQGQDAGSQSGGESDHNQDSEKARRAAALAELLESGAAAGSESAAGSEPPADPGVSQNALELLTDRQQLPAAATTAPEAAQRQAESDEDEIVLDSEGVIAIEDLENVRLDARDAEKD